MKRNSGNEYIPEFSRVENLHSEGQTQTAEKPLLF